MTSEQLRSLYKQYAVDKATWDSSTKALQVRSDMRCMMNQLSVTSEQLCVLCKQSAAVKVTRETKGTQVRNYVGLVCSEVQPRS